MTRKVFISHKDTDTDLAEKVAERVKASGFSVYLDSIDNTLKKDGADLTEYLLSRMGECQQLIAVISTKTKASWWVPWEIGVGSEKGFNMATYAQSYVVLPDYLEKWPVLRSLNDVDLYCQYSQSSRPTTFQLSESRMSPTDHLIGRKSRAAKFHRELKDAIS